MAYPTVFSQYAEIVLPEPSGNISDITLPIPCSIFTPDFLADIGSGGKDIRFYDELANELAYDPVNVTGVGSGLGGYFNCRYRHNFINSSSFIRAYVGTNSVDMPEPTSIYGQYNAYDGFVEEYWGDGYLPRTSNQRNLTYFGTPVTGVNTGPFAGSRYTELDGTTEYGLCNYDVANVPRTMMGWGYSTSLSANQALLSVADSGSNVNYADVEFAGTAPFNPVRANAATSSGAEVYSNKTEYFANTWTHLTSVENVSGHRTIFLNGTGGTANTTARDPVVNRVGIGCLANNTISRRLSGRVGPVSIHSTDRDAGWINYLYKAESNPASFYSVSEHGYIPPPLSINGYVADVTSQVLINNSCHHFNRETTNTKNVTKMSLDLSLPSVMSSGTGFNKVDIVYYDEETITGSKVYDLSNTEAEFLGVNLTSQFRSLRQLIIVNDGPQEISVSTNASNVLNNILGGSTSPMSIESGCNFTAINPAGWSCNESGFVNMTISVASGESSYKLLIVGEQDT